MMKIVGAVRAQEDAFEGCNATLHEEIIVSGPEWRLKAVYAHLCQGMYVVYNLDRDGTLEAKGEFCLRARRPVPLSQ